MSGVKSPLLPTPLWRAQAKTSFDFITWRNGTNRLKAAWPY